MRSNSLSPLLYLLLLALPSTQASSLGSKATITSAKTSTTISTLLRVVGTNTATSTRPTVSSKLSTTTRTSTKSSIKATTSTKLHTTIKTSTRSSARTITSLTPTSTKSTSKTTTSAKPSTTTTTSTNPIVTDKAYIDTVIRHHNVHRANHSAVAISWSASLAETARIISSSCVWGHNTTVNNGGYGQNIGAGYKSNTMGQFITDGLYNSEVNAYSYYGGEPNFDTLGEWGHFSQIVWKATTSVGCYTYDCSKTGLEKAAGVPPYFTVCNYSPAGNVVGYFAQNVGKSLQHASVDASYGCENAFNCIDAAN